MKKYCIVIDDEEYVGTPTLTKTEIEKTFEAALAEWPEVRASLNQKLNTMLALEAEDDVKFSPATGKLYEEFLEIQYDWLTCHGVDMLSLSPPREQESLKFKLTAWTEKGKVDGPIIKWPNSNDKETGSLEFKSTRVLSVKEVGSAFEAALAEWPEVSKESSRIRNVLKAFQEQSKDRMGMEALRLQIESCRINREWEERHGVVEKWIDDRDHFGFYMVALTKAGRIIGPKLEATEG